MEPDAAGPRALHEATEQVREHRRAMAAAPPPSAWSLKSGIVGRDVLPYVGMRVRHLLATKHEFSRGLLGTVEIIPGR